MEVPDAFSTLRRGGELQCLDRESNVVQRFPSREVKAYSSDPSASEALIRASAQDQD